MSDNVDLIEGRYDRLERIEWWQQDRLRDAHVMVVGAGALGNEILKNLALLGVGNILVVDFDTIALSNLTRSILFREEDAGKSKAKTAVAQLQKINPDINAVAIDGNLRWDVGLGVYRRMDVVLAGLDSLGARLAVNQMCWRVNTPWIDGGLNELNGMMRTFIPPEGACFECGLTPQDYQELNMRYSCQLVPRDGLTTGHIPTTPTSASLVAALQVQEAVKLLHQHPIATAQGLSYNGQTHSFFVVNYKQRPDCLGHTTLAKIHGLPLSSKTTIAELMIHLRQKFGEDVTVELDRELVTSMTCVHCLSRTKMLTPHFRIKHDDVLCPNCGNERTLNLRHRLDGNESFASASLETLGIPPLHILTVKNAQGQEWHVELTDDLQLEPWISFFTDTREKLKE